MKKELFTTLFLSFFFLLSSFSQSEGTLLHLDKALYVTGEVVWYKFYLPIAMKNQEAIFEVVISDQKGEMLEQYYLKTEGKTYVEGYYKIPFTAPSNWYQISFISAGNTKEIIANASFPVYNDLDEPKTITSSTLEKQQEINLDEISIDVQLNQTDYSPREQVEVKIIVKDENNNPIDANFSVAVIDDDLVVGDKLVKGEKFSPPKDYLSITGTLVNEQGIPMRASVLGMYSSLEDRIFYSSADKEGRFYFKTPDFYGKRPVQFIGYQLEHEDISIRMDDKKVPPILQSLPYTEEIRTYLALSKQRKKIFQIHTSLESQLEYEKYKLDIQELNSDISYKIREYESFDFMYSFFGELITALKFEWNKDSTYTATLYNPTGSSSANTELSGKPLFIIDGKLTRDADFVARMDMDYIEQVDLFYKTDNLRKKFSAFGRNGVVKITTNLKDVPIAKKDAEDVFTISGFQPKAVFPIFNPANITTNQPFFRPQLYWNPNLKTNKKGEANFTFYQSDDVSTFVIRVVAQGENGEYGTATKTYQVKL